MTRAASSRRRSGVSLLEVLVAASIFAALVGAVASTMNSAVSASSKSAIGADVARRINGAMERIVAAVSAAGAATLVPDPVPPLGASAFSFRQCTGWSAGAATWGNTARIEWQPDPADPTDLADNDKDGLVDEGQVVLRLNFGLSSERNVVLARNIPHYLEGETADNADENANGLVDELGFSVCRVGRTLTFRLSGVARESGFGLAYRTVTVPVTLRN